MKINSGYVLVLMFAFAMVVLFVFGINREADESEYANLAELVKDSKEKNLVNVMANIKDAMEDNYLSKNEYDRLLKDYAKEELKFEMK
jgi:hypothetical protein